MKTSKDPARIRPFQFHGDYHSVYRLWEEAGQGLHIRRSDRPEEIQKKLQRDPDLFLVAEVNEEIIGSILGGFDGHRGIMYHLAVDGSYRR